MATAPGVELPRWDLTTTIGPPDDPTLRAAVDDVVERLDALTARYERLDASIEADTLATLLAAHNDVVERLRLVGAVLHARVSADSGDVEAARLRSAMQAATAPLGVLTTRLGAWAADAPLDDLAAASEEVAAHRYPLQRAADVARHRLSLEAEALAGDLRLSGSVAWANLHRTVSTRLTGELVLDGERSTLGVSALRAMAADADPRRRAAAHEAELAAWASVEHVLGATLNGALGERLTLDRHRGWTDSLAPALLANAVDRPVLDAMLEAVTDALDDFRRYLRAKARLLGHTDGLPWWDLAAPVGTGSSRSWDEAVAQVAEALGRHSPAMRDLVGRAVRERWIDVGPRLGKVGGAFCIGTGSGTSRLLLNFDGTSRGMLTLAHELGHAYHGTRLAHRPPLQRQTPMTLAETASVFCETLTLEAALDAADPADELALLDLDLQGATQIVVDIFSRFLFERDILAARAAGEVPPAELRALMTRAQHQAYGDGLDPQHGHPWMWAVKSHYFTPFYNWPYTFGLLFALGLGRSAADRPEAFAVRYDDLLADTGVQDPVTLAARFGMDLGDPATWASSLDVLRARIDRFVALAAPAHQDG